MWTAHSAEPILELACTWNFSASTTSNGLSATYAIFGRGVRNVRFGGSIRASARASGLVLALFAALALTVTITTTPDGTATIGNRWAATTHLVGQGSKATTQDVESWPGSGLHHDHESTELSHCSTCSIALPPADVTEGTRMAGAHVARIRRLHDKAMVPGIRRPPRIA